MSWYDEAMQTRDFADALVEAEYIDDAAMVLAKPYKFTSEFLAWKSAGFPEPITDDSSEENDAAWNSFVEALNSTEEETEE